MNITNPVNLEHLQEATVAEKTFVNDYIHLTCPFNNSHPHPVLFQVQSYQLLYKVLFVTQLLLS